MGNCLLHVQVAEFQPPDTLLCLIEAGEVMKLQILGNTPAPQVTPTQPILRNLDNYPLPLVHFIRPSPFPRPSVTIRHKIVQ